MELDDALLQVSGAEGYALEPVLKHALDVLKQVLEREGKEMELEEGVELGKCALIEKLVAEGADVNARDELKRTPLIILAGMGDVEAVKVVLELKADKDARTVNGITALIAACVNGEVETARVLLDHEVDMEAKDNHHGWTAIEWAAAYGEFGAVKLLVEGGAKELERARDRANLKGHKEIAAYLADQVQDRKERTATAIKAVTPGMPSGAQRGPGGNGKTLGTPP